jgi:hypothetical protein
MIITHLKVKVAQKRFCCFLWAAYKLSISIVTSINKTVQNDLEDIICYRKGIFKLP